MTKAERIKKYNEANPSYNITNIKKMTVEQLNYYRVWGKTDIWDLYDKPSHAKVESWQEIKMTYNPSTIIGAVGNSMTYSVVIEAGNGDILHITKQNNYLIDVIDE